MFICDGTGLYRLAGWLVVVVYISFNAMLAVALAVAVVPVVCDGLGVGVIYAEFLNITGRQRAGAV